MVRRLATGSLVKRLDVDRNRTIALDRAIASGQRAADDAHATERRADVQDYADQFITMGVNSVDGLIGDNWDHVDRTERAIIVAALKEASHWRSTLR